jgi:segregation and condensation protein A
VSDDPIDDRTEPVDAPAPETTAPEAPPATAAEAAGPPLLPPDMESTLPGDVPRIHLPIFEGPLDLVLYLIRREKIDIHDIPIAPITREYMA